MEKINSGISNKFIHSCICVFQVAGGLEMRACQPVVGRRRENVTLRLVPRANGGRRCQSCVRQNSDSSCGSGQALLSSRDDSAANTPQRRKRHASAEVQKETSLSSSGLGRSVDSEELPEEAVEQRPRPKLQRLPAVEDED